LIIGRLEDVAVQGHAGREEADWHRKRALIRALVKRVDVAHEQVHVVVRVDHLPVASSSEKKVCKIVGGVISPLLALIAFHGMDEAITQLSPQARVIA
jgi:hypothetical protein